MFIFSFILQFVTISRRNKKLQILGPGMARAEGMIRDTASKMFPIAGLVIVYSVFASVVYGLVYWLWLIL